MTTRNRILVAVAGTLALTTILAGTQLGLAEGYQIPDRYGLRGLQAFYVEVGEIPGDLAKYGLAGEAIHREVELQLRKGGAIVMTREQARENPNAPRLHVQILGSKIHNAPLCAYAVTAQFGQAATLVRDPKVAVDAATWSKTGLGTVKTKEVQEVRFIVEEIVDAFLNVYLAENPRR